jgi:hypothetical protein
MILVYSTGWTCKKLLVKPPPKTCFLAQQSPRPCVGVAQHAMVQLSFRGLRKSPSAAPAATPSPAPVSTPTDAASKKARFDVSEEDQKAGAATVMQKFARGKSTRSMKKGGDPETLRPSQRRTSLKGDADRSSRLSRRVSFSSNQMEGWAGQLQVFWLQLDGAVRGCLEQVSSAAAPGTAEPDAEADSNYKLDEGSKPALSAKAREMVRCLSGALCPLRRARTRGRHATRACQTSQRTDGRRGCHPQPPSRCPMRARHSGRAPLHLMAASHPHATARCDPVPPSRR